ncbi:MAG: transglutaminase-like domain-containing protein [Longicatena sp.]
MKVKHIQVLSSLLILSLLTSCGGSSKEYPSEYATSPSPSISQLLLPQSLGVALMNDSAGLVEIDYSNANKGYINAKLLKETTKKVKLSITKDKVGNLPYDLTKVGKVETFPFELGSGNYLIKILQNDSGDIYNIMFTKYIDVQLEKEESAFLYPNQTIDYNAESKAVQKAFELTKKDDSVLKRIATLYNYVVDTISYDDKKAKEVEDIYVLPIIDETLSSKKGICFDYAALLCAMLRSQQIPTRLVTGNTTIEYHAWIEVYIEGKGWIDPEVLLDNNKWSRMDPTFKANDVNYKDEYENKYYY